LNLEGDISIFNQNNLKIVGDFG